jgi:hypothetical protein
MWKRLGAPFLRGQLRLGGRVVSGKNIGLHPVLLEWTDNK